jgi:hypothetical protein
MVGKNSATSASRTLYNVPEAEVGSSAAPRRLVPSFCSIDTILPPRPAHSQCRRAQRRSRMARLRATALAARSVLDGREHGGTLGCVGSRSTPVQPSPQKARAQRHQKPRSRSIEQARQYIDVNEELYIIEYWKQRSTGNAALYNHFIKHINDKETIQ